MLLETTLDVRPIDLMAARMQLALSPERRGHRTGGPNYAFARRWAKAMSVLSFETQTALERKPCPVNSLEA